MKTIENKTRRPVKVPLPGGKFLRLGPLLSGQVRDDAEHHGAVKRLVEEGTITLYGGDTPSHGPKDGFKK